MPSFAPGKDDDSIPSNTLIACVGWMINRRSTSRLVRRYIRNVWPTKNEGGIDEDDPKHL